eukprot:TRINITY_DN1787_c0_g1_i1.p1 TRINITY_DN1787_c0_g1~~TRINITY_DN1787_c0_g1_i1.p1  ORF type:complete len:723 (+),score=89.69 TRINITY_DN1787_c0_g1_i1:44-2212(+)
MDFTQLPNELVLWIIEQVDRATDLLNLSQVSGKLRHLIVSLPNAKWRSLYSTRWALDDYELTLMPERSWLEEYKKRHSKENFLRINSSDDLVIEKLKLLLDDQSTQDTLTILKDLSLCVPFKKNTDTVLESIQGARHMFIEIGGLNILVSLLRKYLAQDQFVIVYLILKLIVYLEKQENFLTAIGMLRSLLTIIGNKSLLTLYPKLPKALTHIIMSFAAKDIFQSILVKLGTIQIILGIVNDENMNVGTVINSYGILSYFKTPEAIKQLKSGTIIEKSINCLLNQKADSLKRNAACILWNFIRCGEHDTIIEANGVDAFLELVKYDFKLGIGCIIYLSTRNEQTLGVVGSSKTIKSLIDLLQKEKSFENREQIVRALSKLTQIESNAAKFIELGGLEVMLAFFRIAPVRAVLYSLLILADCMVVSMGANNQVLRERCIANVTPHFDYLIEILSFTQKVKEACVDFWKHCVWVMNLPQNILFKLVEQIIFMLNDKLNSDDLKFLLATLFFNLSDKNVTIHFYYDAKQLVNLALSALQHLSITSTPKRASWAISILTPLARLEFIRQKLVKKQKVLKRVKFWAESRLVPPESRFRGVLCLSYFNTAAKLEPKYLSSIVQFTEETPLDVKWSLVVQSLRPHYVHLFESDVVEFNLLAAWLLAKITHKESGQSVPAYLDPALILALEKLTHPRVVYFLSLYKKNMEEATDRATVNTTRTLQLSQGA